MGNISTRPTKKIEAITNILSDYSLNVSTNIAQQISQNTIVNQVINFDMRNANLNNCTVSVSQSATIVANQVAVFQAMFSNPRELVKQIIGNQNSILNQALNSNDKIMQSFLPILQKQTKSNSLTSLKTNLTSIVRANINQTSIQAATQNTFLNQSMNVNLSNIFCTNSTINITQSSVVNVTQNAFFSLTAGSLLSDPSIKSAFREFNGDYELGLLDEQIDPGMTLPPICYGNKPPVLPPDNPTCPLPPPCNCGSITCPNCENIILKVQTLYLVLGFAFIFLFILTYLKFRNRQKNQ
jgi:hypothetical protein